MPFAQQNSYSDQRTFPGVAGQILEPIANNDQNSRTAGGGLPEIVDLQVLTATATATYTFTFTLDETGESSEISFVAVGATAAAIAAETANAIEQDSFAGTYVTAANGGTDTATITGRNDGQAFTISTADAKYVAPVQTQAATANAAVPFGRMVVAIDDSSDPYGKCRLPAAGDAAVNRPLGVSIFTQTREQQFGSGTSEYLGGDRVNIMEKGIILVELDAGQAPGPTDDVYYRQTVGAGEDAGAFRVDADGGDSVQLTNARWAGEAFTARGVLVCALQLDLNP